VSLLCLIRPKEVMKSEMTEKFCHTSVSIFHTCPSPPAQGEKTNLVHIQRINPQHIHNVLLGRLPRSPLAHLGGRQVVGRVDVAGLPVARHLTRVGVGRGAGAQALERLLLLLLGVGGSPAGGVAHD
jgi:hypothetical protein